MRGALIDHPRRRGQDKRKDARYADKELQNDKGAGRAQYGSNSTRQRPAPGSRPQGCMALAGHWLLAETVRSMVACPFGGTNLYKACLHAAKTDPASLFRREQKSLDKTKMPRRLAQSMQPRVQAA